LVYKTFMGTPVRILAAVAFIFSLTACGGGSSGGGPAECVANQACTPAGGAAACQVYATACTNGQSSCVASNATDGSSCTTGLCSTGVCTSSTTRTVSSALETVYLLDDGTTSTLPGWDANTVFGAAVTALLVPDATDPTGYQTFPVTVGADSHFSVSGVPFGTYFIQVDNQSSRNNAVADPQTGDIQVLVTERVLYEASTSTPDLSIVVSSRPFVLVSSDVSTEVQVNLTGLAPFAAQDVLRAGASQIALNEAYRPGEFNPKPVVGTTTIIASLSWDFTGFSFHPDASKGDSEYLWQRGPQALASDATLTVTKAFTKVSNLTIVDGTANTLTATFAPPPLTGSLAADLRWSKFAELSSFVHPGAAPSTDPSLQPTVSIDAVAHSLSFPNQPIGTLPGGFVRFFDSNLLFPGSATPETFFTSLVLSSSTVSADVSYGNVAYGQFFDSLWKEAAQVFYSWDVPLQVKAGPVAVAGGATYRTFVPRALLPNPLVPEISPPTAPLINGANAFAFQAGAGTKPTLSWSAPSSGTATKYLALVAPSKDFRTGELAQISVVLYDRTSFQVPAGFLTSGNFYYGSLTAVNSPDRMNDPIVRLGSPTLEANTLVGFFQP
jgi:hypothetical protein